jgi:hypothetical protein
MTGLVPAIHVLLGRNESKTWIPGIKPGMTTEKDEHTDHKGAPSAAAFSSETA